MDLVLTPAEARVLASLLEKERTVPASYPLTMSALLTACNQTTSRDPVMELDEADVSAAVESLKAHRLARRVLPSHGNRTVKYRQVADEVLALDDGARAIVAVLMLRGPQTAQELKIRSERIHRFDDATAVEEALAEMAAWRDPLVRRLPKRSGQRDARWAHLLAGEPEAPPWRDLGSTEPAGDHGVAVSGAAAGASAGAGPGARAGAGAGADAGSGAVADPAAALAGEAPEADEGQGPLTALIGMWVSESDGREGLVGGPGADRPWLEVRPVPGERLLTYRTWWPSPPDVGRELSGAGRREAGFLRLTADGEVELIVAVDLGAVEISVGLVEVDDDGRVEIILASDSAAHSPSGAAVAASDRTYRVVGDVLDLDLLAVGLDRGATPVPRHVRYLRRR